jgi:hypothetical protein
MRAGDALEARGCVTTETLSSLISGCFSLKRFRLSSSLLTTHARSRSAAACGTLVEETKNLMLGVVVAQLDHAQLGLETVHGKL